MSRFIYYHTGWHYAECHYAECRYAGVVAPSYILAIQELRAESKFGFVT